MRIALGTLAPGAYEVRWTAVTPDDGAVERGVFRFTMTASASPTGSPRPTVGPGPTVGPQPTASVDASPPPSPSETAPTTTLSTSGPTLPTPSPTASAAGPDVTPTGTDVLLPVVLVLVAGIALGAYLLRRRAVS